MTATQSAPESTYSAVNVDCVHIACAGGACLYRPEVPTAGPDLPRQIRDCEGGLWTRYEGRVFYRQRRGGYALVVWTDLCRGRGLLESCEFPFAGPWEVSVP